MFYDYIEIGCCYYDRLIDNAEPGARGLSVEPVPEFFATLPIRANWACANVAIAETAGKLSMFYVNEVAASRCNKGAWVSGCAMVGKPHPEVLQLLTFGRLCPQDIQEVEVEAITIRDLWARYGVTDIGFLKLDCEGMDCRILGWVLEAGVRFRKVQFETNSLTPENEAAEARQWLAQRGYSITVVGDDTWGERVQSPPSAPRGWVRRTR
jgi:FkbM family methyltransferase